MSELIDLVVLVEKKMREELARIEHKSETKREISDEAWNRVHQAVKAYDPERYEADAIECDQLLGAIYSILSDELERI